MIGKSHEADGLLNAMFAFLATGIHIIYVIHLF